ncbi:bifunctional enoyl-CoA hydratase/phosphate acetyltransferase [Ruegeria sp. ANG-S4]|uniref:bifunctional enoyl-CoA hydratase/phosphate acetyltransferase n=1 Tax=Ruegeria sp. ANG-S4 TaxID=1577904 RepID=UPI00057F505D|nr:bifunctional enoyl-CoA hydratase/phosphate acetyltransferase [Ruegeria sp. ANG-S4]KIC46815.1 bifunctional enoyl-CoA hydratase/phosphate acetyltransferase [Ruegeria sp. ANG-S4]
MKYHNKPYGSLQVGDTAELTRICTEDDFYVFANNSGNHNPLHLAKEDGDGDGVAEAVAPALFIGALVSAVLGNILPGAGTLYKSQSFEFGERAHAGDELISKVTVTEKRAHREVAFDTVVTRKSDGAVIVRGEAVVIAPEKEMVFDEIDLPGLVVQRHRHFDALLDQSRPLPAMPTAVVAPEEPNSLGGALLAARETIIKPVLVGDPEKIKAAAIEIEEPLDGIEIIPAKSHFEAANTAVDLVADGRVNALMKGHLHTDDLLRAALRRERGLRAGRRFTHVFVMDIPGQPYPLLVTDAAINIEPDLETKIDITQNAIELALSIGFEQPRAGILSAVETVNPAIKSSVDAALLSKMAERGQIKGGLVDGPLAMDNAVSIAAARTKGIVSEVAGKANILVVPNLDAGNMVAKQLTFIAHAEGAGVVLGAKVPIILTSRADDDKARLASCAVAALHQARMSEGAI